MKILKENGVVKIYINDIKELDFNETEDLENYFRELFLKLKQNLDLSFTGLYDIHIYLDKLYGAVIELKKEQLEYIDYYENEIDMRMMIHDAIFLYQVEDMLDFLDFTKNVYYYKKHFYLELNEDITKEEFIKIIEMSDIFYKTDSILNHGKKIQTML